MMFRLSNMFRRLSRRPVLVLSVEQRPDLIYKARERLAAEYAAARRGVRCQAVKKTGDALAKITHEALRREVGK